MFFPLSLRYTTKTGTALGVLVGGGALETAEEFEAGFPPLGNQTEVGIALLNKVVEEILGYRLVFVIQIEDVTRPLMIHTNYRPKTLTTTFTVRRFSLGFTHLLLELLEFGLDCIETRRRRFRTTCPDFRH